MAQHAAFGAILQQFDTDSGYVTVAQITDIQGPGLVVDAQDTTAHDSDNESRGMTGGVKEIGEMTMTLNFEPAALSHVSKWTALNNRERAIFTVIFPDVGNTEWAFWAFVTGFEPIATVEGALTASVTFLGTGKPYVDDILAFLVDHTGAYLVDDLSNTFVEI